MTYTAHGIKRNLRPRLTRFLSREEIGRLHGALDRYASTKTSHARQADVIRLLLLTGLPEGRDRGPTMAGRGDTLNLVDANAGPRRVILNASARAIIEKQRRLASAYVFPSPLHPERPLSHDLTL